MSSPSFELNGEELAELRARNLVTETFVRLQPERRNAVVGALLEQAAERGADGINIKLVAREAGVPVGSLYQYFPDREGLVRAACAMTAARLGSAFAAALPYLVDLPLREALETYLVEGIAWSRREGAFLRAFGVAAYRGAVVRGDAELRKAFVAPVAEALFGLIRALVEAAEARGELRRGIDIEGASRTTHALLCAAGDALLFPGLDDYYLLYGDGAPPESRIKCIVDILCSGLEARDGDRPSAGERNGK